MTAAHGCCRIIARIERKISEAEGLESMPPDDEIYKGV